MLRLGLSVYLPLIASGRLDSELVVRYAGQKTLLGYLPRLHSDDQQKLVSESTVQLVRLDASNQLETVAISLHDLGSQQINQVCDDGRIRPPAEQIRRIIQPSHRRKKKSKTIHAQHVALDADQRAIQIGRTKIKADLLLPALSELHGVNVADLLQAQGVSIELPVK
ncbi:MAG: hypothetical protein ACJAWL_003619 [Motiliproteus sp.]|jgi:hypothetical protein